MSENNIMAIAMVVIVIAFVMALFAPYSDDDKETQSLIDNAIIAHEAQYHRNVEVVK